MSGFNFGRSQLTAHRIITRWGASGFLVRAGVKRPAMIARLEYKPSERGLFLDGSERLYVSAYQLTVPPDHEQDVIEWIGSIYKINGPPTGSRPAGIVVYYDCNCLRTGAA